MSGYRDNKFEMPKQILLFEVYEPGTDEPYEITADGLGARDTARDVGGTVVKAFYIRVKEVP